MARNIFKALEVQILMRNHQRSPVLWRLRGERESGKVLCREPVAVRSPNEILSTLDGNGTLDGVPFMPEMLDWCGKPFRVQRRVEKTCVDGRPNPTLSCKRRSGPWTARVAMAAVTTDASTAAGFSGRGLVASCRLGRCHDIELANSGLDKLRARLKVKSDERHYFCQSTELYKATEAFLPGEQASAELEYCSGKFEMEIWACCRL